MQDLQTGELKPIDPKFLEGVDISSNKIEDLTAIERAKDATIPDRDRQGPIFRLGEELEIKGARFRIGKLTHRRLYLDSLPAKSAGDTPAATEEK